MDDNWGSPRESLTCSGSQLKIMHRTDAFKPTTCWFCCGKLGFSQGGCTYWHECCYLLIRCLFSWFLLFWEFLLFSGCWLMLVDSCRCILSFIAIGCTRTVLILIAMIIHFVVCTHGKRLVITMYIYIISSHIITVMYAYVAPYYYIIMYTSYLDGGYRHFAENQWPAMK